MYVYYTRAGIKCFIYLFYFVFLVGDFGEVYRVAARKHARCYWRFYFDGILMESVYTPVACAAGIE